MVRKRVGRVSRRSCAFSHGPCITSERVGRVSDAPLLRLLATHANPGNARRDSRQPRGNASRGTPCSLRSSITLARVSSNPGALSDNAWVGAPRAQRSAFW